MTSNGEANQFDTVRVFVNVPQQEREILRQLRSALRSGENTGSSLLMAAAKWSLSEEVIEDNHHRYILAGEAFDLLSLMNRLAGDCEDIIPRENLADAVFVDEYALIMLSETLRMDLGSVKYNQYLNYFYGILLEEILIFATEDEVKKMYSSNGFRNVAKETDIALIRLYGANERTLLDRYCAETGQEPIKRDMTVTQKKEFTYWLFKYRMRSAEPAKAASDVSKALTYIQVARNKSAYPSLMDVIG
jgi:hypothetical protein